MSPIVVSGAGIVDGKRLPSGCCGSLADRAEFGSGWPGEGFVGGQGRWRRPVRLRGHERDRGDKLGDVVGVLQQRAWRVGAPEGPPDAEIRNAPITCVGGYSKASTRCTHRAGPSPLPQEAEKELEDLRCLMPCLMRCIMRCIM